MRKAISGAAGALALASPAAIPEEATIFPGQAANAREPPDDMVIGYLIEPDSIVDGDT